MHARGAELLLDVSRLIGRLANNRLPTGVDRVALAYVRHYGPRAQAVVQRGRFRRIASERTSQQIFALLQRPDAQFGRRWHRIVRQALLSRWPSQDGQGRVYLNVGHTGLGEPDFGEWLQRHRMRGVFMVHDLVPITHPEFCRTGESALHGARMRTATTCGAALVSNSQHTLDSVRDFARRHALHMPPAVVAPLACDPFASHAASAPPPAARPYFVMLGTIEPRKNHWLILQLWRQLVEMQGEAAPALVLIGQRGWQCQDVSDMLERSVHLKRHVQVLPHCSDAQLAAYLRHARALLFPSFAEGYGLPLIEALSARLPALCSDLPAFREAAGCVPDYLDVLDGAGWLRAIVDYAPADSVRRSAQMRRLATWEAPTWHGHFERVDALLEQLG